MLRSPRPAFTLIELLVVTGIIALLAAVLLPSLGHARWQTKTVACRANLHDLGGTLIMYTHQFQEFYPVTTSDRDSFFALRKARMLKDVRILQDPGTRNVIRAETLGGEVAYTTCVHQTMTDHIPYFKYEDGISDLDDNAPGGAQDATGGHSYEYLFARICELCPCGPKICRQGPGPDGHRRATHFRNTALMPIVHDADDSINGNAPGRAPGCLNSDQNDGDNCPQEWDNHGARGMNMLFADGHAEWVRKTSARIDRCIPVCTEFGCQSLCENPNYSIDRILARIEDPRSYR